ncbi:MAG TPA: acyl carrier protein [Magnetovibrio sp.]
MVQSALKEKVQAYLEDQFLFEFGDGIDDKTDLFKEGVIDSFGYVQLVDFLQREFSIEFNDEEMLTNIMISLDRIVETVGAKQSVAKGS